MVFLLNFYHYVNSNNVNIELKALGYAHYNDYLPLKMKNMRLLSSKVCHSIMKLQLLLSAERVVSGPQSLHQQRPSDRCAQYHDYSKQRIFVR